MGLSRGRDGTWVVRAHSSLKIAFFQSRHRDGRWPAAAVAGHSPDRHCHHFSKNYHPSGKFCGLKITRLAPRFVMLRAARKGRREKTRNEKCALLEQDLFTTVTSCFLFFSSVPDCVRIMERRVEWLLFFSEHRFILSPDTHMHHSHVRHC